jgi:DNA-binding Xre family transcriptional regulator
MAIIVRLDVMLALRKMRSKELAARIGITEQNLSLLKSGKVKASVSKRWNGSAPNSTASPATC